MNTDSEDCKEPLGFISSALQEVEEVTPESGFNVCVYDSWERLGEKLTITAWFPTREEAEAYANEQRQNGSVMYIYGAKPEKQDENKIQKAQKVMESAHEDQFRKNDITPYSTHPETVVKTLKLLGVEDFDILCAGYLHDVLEDTKYPAEKIQENFGDRVLSIVNELTFEKGITDEQYWDRCQNMSSDAKWVKIADILSNLSDEGEKSSHFVQKRIEALKRLLNGFNLNQNLRI